MEQLTFDFSEQPEPPKPPCKKRPGGYAGRVYKDRPCDDCGVVYTPGSSGQKRCEACQAERTRVRANESATRLRRAAYVPRYCADCGTELPPPNGSARPRVRCEPCAKAEKAAGLRRRNAARAESRKAYDAQWREANREATRASNRKYKAAHPEADEAANARRRSRLKEGMTDEDCRLSRLFRQVSKDFPCFYCGAPVPVEAKPHELEHYFALSEFGTDHFWNLLRACQACNRGPGGKFKQCGTAFLLRTLPPGADWPRPVTLAEFPPLPAAGILFPPVKAADYYARHQPAA